MICKKCGKDNGDQTCFWCDEPLSCKRETAGSLSDLAGMYLEECHVSGDSMLNTDHSIDDLPDLKGGAFYVADLMAGFVERMRKENDGSELPGARR